MTWEGESWKKAARAGNVLEVHNEPDRLRCLRQFLNDNVSLEATWRATNSTPGRAASATVEALMYSFRERGTKALEEPDTRRRLSELSKDQLAEIGDRLQRLKPKIARAWTADEINTLVETYGRLRCR